ncbi:Retrovirus-related Pol polyprotein from transposon TNT 1-94 [Araneus ventricosus]|uniref:Retrovirus-related Pol polyprotein from transposon TNT 1-94 n=1 Tax=Araneus ventricosus TaxID=182803 RepID=A0A4Y2X8S2_ARAVE|nr:Retrovirus-related Pol polyprotein from transposon TNT 1-94 [Araneus ventricosus]
MPQAKGVWGLGSCGISNLHEDSHRPLICDTKDASPALEKLKQHFRSESRARAVALTDEFFSCRIQERETTAYRSYREYAACLRKVMNQLKDAGEPIAELYQSFQVILYLQMEFSVSSINDLEVWHREYCHVNPHYRVNTSNNDSVRELPHLKGKAIRCEPCRLVKSKRHSFKPIGKIRSTKPLELLHLDVCGPLPSNSIQGNRYFLSITDDYSRNVTTFPMKRETEVFSCSTIYQKRAETSWNSKIVNIRTYNGMKFCYIEFSKFLQYQGIHAECTKVYSPEQNGVSERFNYTTKDAVKAMLKDSALRNSFWVEALMCFTNVWNRVCHRHEKKTPFELFGGRKPSVKHFRIFGITAYVGIPKQTRSKLQMRSKKGIMVGYALQMRGYRIWIPSERRVVETINVTFDKKRAARTPASESPENTPEKPRYPFLNYFSIILSSRPKPLSQAEAPPKEKLPNATVIN